MDGENFAAAPVGRILERFPDVVLAVVYAVPDPVTGDQVMAALQLRPGTVFDPEAFAAFLTDQPDMGTKWLPRFVRVAEALPITATSKVLIRLLRGRALARRRPGLVVTRAPGHRLPPARAAPTPPALDAAVDGRSPTSPTPAKPRYVQSPHRHWR